MLSRSPSADGAAWCAESEECGIRSGTAREAEAHPFSEIDVPRIQSQAPGWHWHRSATQKFHV